ncbi:Outer membrane protein MIP precursor [Vibrio thalassae]|uniref:Peptidyl-prolyl cis-trans isomerase n=1 Tax=Vibrio thalassae TaxID=1243014 RepID=A0A240ELW1_9VIBR|nr:FKBP-type peptidyl-prolyl cis-trans isomerase [Vibrio thalassae]SNX49682.1 Outer membrane protein MIP precursor [Vibrio thalassae]
MSKVLIPLIVLLLAAFMIYRTWTNSKAGEENLQKGQAFLQENAKKDGIITTESGLQYEVLHTSGNTEKPGPKSKVKVHYHGTLIDGTVFDSSVDRGTPISFGLNQVIKGWQEGLQYMSESDKYRLYIPSTLGYGKNGSGPIPPSAVLIFDVELIEIQ